MKKTARKTDLLGIRLRPYKDGYTQQLESALRHLIGLFVVSADNPFRNDAIEATMTELIQEFD